MGENEDTMDGDVKDLSPNERPERYSELIRRLKGDVQKNEGSGTRET